jgi:organic radical activating enzyme
MSSVRGTNINREPIRVAETADANDTAAGVMAEVFCSLQGEGPYVGERQVFLRTAGCSLGCRWCDTENGPVPSSWHVFFGDVEKTFPNPTDAETAAREVLSLADKFVPVDTVSITGGEPLEQPEFTAILARRISEAGLKVYLETNGVHAEAFAGIMSFVDVVAMDVKLPSATGTDLWGEHEAFLSRIKGTRFDPRTPAVGEQGVKKDFFVKVVLDDRARLSDVVTAARIVAATNRKIPLVLQPESGAIMTTRTDGAGARGYRSFIEKCWREAGTIVDDVRVIPQCHRLLGIK